MADTDPLQVEVEVLFTLVSQRYGSRLAPAELEGVRKGIQGIVEAARALRALRLANSDEPSPPFAPYRAEP